MKGRSNTVRLGIAVAVLVLLVAAPVASAAVLLEDTAEREAERYAYEASGGSAGFMSVDLSGQEKNIYVTRTDSGKCRRRSDLVRVCPVVYEGKDYTQESCRDAPLVPEENPTENTAECFDTVVCRQTVVVTLRSVGRRRDLGVRASDMTCTNEGQAVSTTP